MISGQSFPSYPHSELEEALRHLNASNVQRLPPREFMAGWFTKRYPDAKERAWKLQIFCAICDYLTEFRETLDDGRVMVAGSDASGDLVPGTVTAVLLHHFIVDLTPPKPEQVIAACHKRKDRRRT